MQERYLRIEIPLKNFEGPAERELIKAMFDYLHRNGISEYEFTVSSYDVPVEIEVRNNIEPFLDSIRGLRVDSDEQS